MGKVIEQLVRVNRKASSILGIKSSIVKANFYFNEVSRRQRIAESYYRGIMPYLDRKPLTKDQIDAIHQVWHSREGMYDIKWFEFFNSLYPTIGTEVCYFTPFDYWLTYMDTYLVPPEKSKVIDDKNLYDMLFTEVKQPKTVLHIASGIYLDETYGPLSDREAEEHCRAAGNIVIKSANGSCGGGGISFWNAEKDSHDDLERLLHRGGDYVVQELVHQHPVMASLCSTSCNTIRMLSYVSGQKSKAVTAYVRFGKEGSRVDNGSAGGYMATINDDGVILNNAVDFKNQKTDISKTYDGPRVIPNYKKCQELAERIAFKIAPFCRAISWDFAIDENSDPVLIEVNLGLTSMQFFQWINGPVMKDYIPGLLDEMPAERFPKNAFTDFVLRSINR